MCLPVTLSSSLQAHHTVWRKLKQQAEKLVRTANILVLFLPHTAVQQQRLQSWSTEANCVLGQWSGPDDGYWSKWLFVSHSASSLPGCRHHCTFHTSSQRLGFNTAIFIALHSFFGKNREETQRGQEKVSHPRHEGQTAVFWTSHERQTLTQHPRKKYF